MMDMLKVLKKYFNTGTAEGELSFLDNAFIPLEDYMDAISITSGNPRLLIGKKGSGKSAFLRFFKSQMVSGGIPVLLLRPKDIQLENTGNSESLGALTRLAENAIIKAIGAQLGCGINGITLRNEDSILFELAKAEGYKNQDTVQKLLKILAPIGQAITKVDFDKISNISKGIASKGIKKAIESSLGNSNKVFYVLIDDTDQVASPERPDHLNRIWAFILASRAIMEECENLKCIISLREEVWRRLKRDQAGQRDQVDHFRNLAFYLNPTDHDIEKIIEKRLSLACSDLKINNIGDPYRHFFHKEYVQIISVNEKDLRWSDSLVKRSRQRPRDAIQLIANLINRALHQKKDFIQSSDVEYVLPIYSEERIDDLKLEVDAECPQIKEIVRAFASLDAQIGSSALSPDTIFALLNNLPTRFSIRLFSVTLRPNDREHVFLLWRFLHEIGFLIAKNKDGNLISIAEDPDLVSVSRWNDMQNIIWNIHPAYRDYVIKVQNERKFSFGVKVKLTLRGHRVK